MKIVILNECFLDDDHFKRLKALGELAIFKDSDSRERAIERLKDADIAIVDGFVCPLDADVIKIANNLKLLVLAHTGFSMIDLNVAGQKGIKVANAPGFSRRAVAELALGLAFAVNRKIALGDREMRVSPFEADPSNEKHQKYFGFDFYGKTWGVVGLGKIGSEVARLAQALGMRVVAYNRTPKSLKEVEMCSLEEVLKRSDVVSINLALNKETENIISAHQFSTMKPNTILINVGAAKHVDTEALYKALKENKIGGAGLDIVAGAGKDHPIFSLENVVFTPHIGSFTKESFMENLPEIVTSNIESFVRGTPKNLIN